MDPAADWLALLRPDVELQPAWCAAFTAAMRARKLTFGDRVHCRVLRPFFLTAADQRRVRSAAETMAAIGERIASAAAGDPDLLAALGVADHELALIRLDPGYPTASTASRLDAFLLPDSLHFAEYNGESPAGPAYTQLLSELFDSGEPMARFRQDHSVSFHPTIAPLLFALLESYREWGGREAAPSIAIVDWRGVPTWTEFELLRDAFVQAGVPTIVCDPTELTFENGVLGAQGRRIDLVYRRVLINDIMAKPDECAALVNAYAHRAACVANAFRCKLPHKKAFFAVLTDPDYAHLLSLEEQAVVRAHVPWTRLVADRSTDRHGRREGLLEAARRDRDVMVLKPNDEYGGTGVTLGWEASETQWEDALRAALADPPGSWVIQERIPVRRELFPWFDDAGQVTMREMLVDLAPYLFRGRMGGYLTRLSFTGLANVTSGGGQVPAFVVD
jgi:hypothetical protein